MSWGWCGPTQGSRHPCDGWQGGGAGCCGTRPGTAPLPGSPGNSQPRRHCLKTHTSFFFSVADPGCLSRIRIFSILDSNFFHPGSRIRIFPSRIPDPHKRIEACNPRKVFLSSRKYDSGCSSRVPIFYPSRIPGSKRHWIPDPQQWIF